jgi:hypothetical protein
MVEFNLKHKRLKLPLYDIGAITAGFYIGYNEGKGIDVRPTIEYLTKYGPTIFCITTTPIIIKLTNSFGKWINKKQKENLQNGNLEISLKNGSKKYKELSESQKEEITPRLTEIIDNFETRYQDPKYLMPTLYIGTKTAIETTIGYLAGRLYSQIN